MQINSNTDKWYCVHLIIYSCVCTYNVLYQRLVSTEFLQVINRSHTQAWRRNNWLAIFCYNFRKVLIKFLVLTVLCSLGGGCEDHAGLSMNSAKETSLLVHCIGCLSVLGSVWTNFFCFARFSDSSINSDCLLLKNQPITLIT